MIELKNITKKFGDNILFEDYSLWIEEGKMVAITGKSGCGKSTLLNIMGLLEPPDKGEVCIDGMNNIVPQSMRATEMLRYEISYLFQNFALVDEKDVIQNLEMALRYVKCNKKKKIKEALSYVGLEGYEKKKIYQLSGGEQQRVALARCILKPSKIILADEPTGSLDPENRDRVLSLLRKMQRDGKTIVIVTHDGTVANMCDEIVEL